MNDGTASSPSPPRSRDPQRATVLDARGQFMVEANRSGDVVHLEVLGQDGLGVAPYDPVTDDTYRRALLGLTGHPEHAWNWGSFGEYLEALEEHLGEVQASKVG